MRRITFSRLGKQGRLGNQLFQITGTVGLGKKHGLDPVFPKWRYARYFHPHPDLRFGYHLKAHILRERSFHHHEWDIPSRGDVDIHGYLQSAKYFPAEDVIRFRSGFLRIIKEKHEKLLSRKTLGLQIRRGDYVNNPNYTQLTMGYFISAMEKHFPDWEERNIVIFSDDQEYCKVHFGNLPNVSFSRMNEVEDMALMSMMDGLIISNSSYGWWGAWFASQHGAKIVRPSRHVEGELAMKSNIKDLYPDEWLVHEWDSKIDLMDCTFTIPVSYDHPDREENLRLTLDQIGRDFVTNVIIQEQSGRSMKFEGFRKSKNVIEVLHFQSRTFHRTAMLNQMARHAKTPYIANWDADMLSPPMQLLMTLKALRSGGVDVCYPYDGVFARVPRKPWFQKIRETDIGTVKKSVFQGMTEGFVSVGGAVFANRESFLRAGGENEKFISYSPEDVERSERFPRLGLVVHRVKGPIYHMDHYVGVNSCKDNPYFAAGERELERIRRMTDDQLRKEFLK